MTAWDVRALRGTAALGALLFCVACLIGGATDEGSITWATRIARALPLVPLCGAAVTFLVMRRAERRGETLAFESIGCSPARVALFVVAAACALSVASAIAVVAFRGVSLDAFFPRASAHTEPRIADGAFVDDARGVWIDRDGVMTRRAPEAHETELIAESGRTLAAAGVLVALGVALPLVAARAARRATRHSAREIAGAGAMCVLCIFLLQAAAAGRAPPFLALLPATALLIFAVVRYRSPAW